MVATSVQNISHFFRVYDSSIGLMRADSEQIEKHAVVSQPGAVGRLGSDDRIIQWPVCLINHQFINVLSVPTDHCNVVARFRPYLIMSFNETSAVSVLRSYLSNEQNYYSLLKSSVTPAVLILFSSVQLVF